MAIFSLQVILFFRRQESSVFYSVMMRVVAAFRTDAAVRGDSYRGVDGHAAFEAGKDDVAIDGTFGGDPCRTRDVAR